VNDFGQLGAASTETCSSDLACSTTPVSVTGGIRFAHIAIGGDHICGATVDGAVYCWGRNHVGQLGDGTLTNRSVPTPAQF
jgi:alpha-tubulin suppressor-like RCC1 family protein